MSEAPRVPPLSKPATTQQTRLADALKRQPYEPSGTIGAPYRGTLAELLGDGGTLIQRLANKLDEYAVNIPIPGQGTTLADLVRGQSPSARISLKDLTLGNAGQVIEDWSYGSPPVRGGNLVTGGIGTYGLKPEALDLFNLAPPVAAAANLGRKGAKVLAPTAREMVREGAESFMDEIGARPKAVYHRYTNGGPDNGTGYMMYAGDASKVENGYGKNHWVVDDAQLPPGSIIDADSPEFRKMARRALVRDQDTTKQYWNGQRSFRDLVRALVGEAAPNDIVNSAGLWDSPDLVDSIYRHGLDPNMLSAVRTPDGLISFDPAHAVKAK